MKKIVSRILPLFMAFAMVFSFAACGGDEKTTTEATDEGTTLAEDVNASVDGTTAPIEPTISENETLPLKPGVTPTNSDTTTTKKPVDPTSGAAPVNGTIEQIVSYYNGHANATKKFAGTVTVFKSEGQTSEITKFVVNSKTVKKWLNDALMNKTGDFKDFKKTFTNGVSSDGDKLIKFLPPSGKETMSTLTADGAKSATCTKVDGGWKVVITLKQEVVGFNGATKYHDATMDTLTLSDQDVEDFGLVVDSCTFDYAGATITAVINKDGYLKSLNIYEPVNISGKVKKILQTTIAGAWKQDISFTY